MRTEELEERLGQQIRALRIAHHQTQAALAEAANVSIGAIKGLERGSGSTTSTLVKVLRALGEEGWIDALGPGPAPFNPLDVLESRRAADRASGSRRQRVRRRPAAP
jgi:transcriptional regulator with XRE-family HTH domain